MKPCTFSRCLSLLLALLLCTSALLACNNEPAPDNTPDDTPTDTPNDTPDTPADPEPEPESEAPTYRVLIASDTHCTDLMDWYGLTNEERMELWYDSVIAEHKRDPFDLIIIAGDISLDTHAGETCYTKGYSTSEIFMEDYVGALPKSIPVFVLAGNHESQYDEDWVDMTGNSRQCTYVLGNNTFIMLDSFEAAIGEVDNGGPYTQANVAYIKEQMEAYPENNVYLVSHTFPIDEGMGGESAEFRELLCDERIIGLFGGHTHLNTLVQYNESCGNKIQAQTGNFSYTNGSFDTAFWGFRELIITEDSAITNYIQVECDVVLNGEERHYDRKLTESVDFMNPATFNDFVADDGTKYTKLYDYINYASIQGDAGNNAGEEANAVLDGKEHTKWCLPSWKTGTATMSWSMTEPVKLLGYVITTGNDEPARTPKTWTLFAGNSPEDMKIIDDREGVEITSLPRTNSEVFIISNPGEYQYYELVITENAGGATMYQFSELILLGAHE